VWHNSPKPGAVERWVPYCCWSHCVCTAAILVLSEQWSTAMLLISIVPKMQLAIITSPAGRKLSVSWAETGLPAPKTWAEENYTEVRLC